MRVWHICSKLGFYKFQESGVKRGDARYICDPSFRQPYLWMIQQMEQRLPVPRPPGAHPLWVWYRWDGVDRAEPDLAEPHGAPGDELVLIELDVPAEHTLLSDFSLWHVPLNNFLLDSDEHAVDCYIAKRDLGLLTESDLKRAHKSWEKIFELDFYDESWTSRPEDKSIQGCIWQVYWEQVKSYQHFVSACSTDEHG